VVLESGQVCHDSVYAQLGHCLLSRCTSCDKKKSNLHALHVSRSPVSENSDERVRVFGAQCCRCTATLPSKDESFVSASFRFIRLRERRPLHEDGIQRFVDLRHRRDAIDLDESAYPPLTHQLHVLLVSRVHRSG